MMACGAKGVISVTANIAPAQVKQMVTAATNGDYTTARKIHLELLELHQAMFIEANPVPVKTSASLMGLCGDLVRLPLSPLETGNRKKLQAILKKFGLI